MCAEDVEFIMKQLYGEYEAPLHYYDASGNLCCAFGYPEEKYDPFLQDTGLYQTLRGSLKKEPGFFWEARVLYGMFTDAENNFIITGPVTISELSPLELARYCESHWIEKKGFWVCRTTMPRLANFLSVLLFIFKGEKIGEQEIIGRNSSMVEQLHIAENEYISYLMDNSEQGMERLSYGFEKEWMEAIRTGSLDLIDAKATVDCNDRIGTMAKKSMKQLEYTCVCSITLATRAAIEGGVKPLEAYSVSDLYLQKLESAMGPEDIFGIMDKMFRDFVERVRKKQCSEIVYDYIEKCKDYVTKHINQKIVISEIADSIPINASYLSRKFSEQEGMTIQKYIVREKTRAAANMLRFSEYKLSEIAQYLGFSSQSNMSKQFKEIYGMSPLEYRRRNQVVDF